MAQTKKRQATKTAKKGTTKCNSCQQKKRVCCQSCKEKQQSNMVFVISMTALAATLLFADLLMIAA